MFPPMRRPPFLSVSVWGSRRWNRSMVREWGPEREYDHLLATPGCRGTWDPLEAPMGRSDLLASPKHTRRCLTLPDTQSDLDYRTVPAGRDTYDAGSTTAQSHHWAVDQYKYPRSCPPAGNELDSEYLRFSGNSRRPDSTTISCLSHSDKPVVLQRTCSRGEFVRPRLTELYCVTVRRGKVYGVVVSNTSGVSTHNATYGASPSFGFTYRRNGLSNMK